MFSEKKNLSVRRKIFKVWRGEKNVSVEFRVFGKKRNVWGRKKIKVFWVKILLSSCSLVGLYVNSQVKVKKSTVGDKNNCRCLKLRLQRKFKIRDSYLLDSYPLVGRHVVKHGLKEKSEI